MQKSGMAFQVNWRIWKGKLKPELQTLKRAAPCDPF